MNRLIQLNKATPLFLIVFALGCIALLPNMQAVSPAPDGGYPGGNTAEGQSALLNLTSGHHNSAVGFLSLRSDATGSYNTAIGAAALLANTADQNTATGFGALLSNTIGTQNTATGAAALFYNTTGFQNTANGAFALFSNTTGNRNNAFGFQALFSHVSGDFNNALGAFALWADQTGFENDAFGDAALFNNTTGIRNTAVGDSALGSNTTGSNNTANGAQVLLANTTGSANTANGAQALESNMGDYNTATGFQALNANTSGTQNTATGNAALFNNTTGSGNIGLGFESGYGVTTAIDVICIGIDGENVSNTTWINHIYQTTTQSGTTLPVIVSNNGQLGTAASSRRFKKEIKAMDKASEAILALKPVKFQYKSDKTNTPQFGLVAEDVEKVNPDLVVRDKEGQPYAVRYDQVNAMLLNEFLKAHRKMEEQDATIARQQKQIDALTVGLQKVRTQIELSKSAPQTVLNNQ